MHTTGTVDWDADHTTQAITQVNGPISRLLVDTGAVVAADQPLLQFDNVIASPHTAGMTREARANMGRIAAEQMLDALDGKPVTRIVNPQVWPAYANRFERAFGFTPKR